jgi:hypothetical protein
MGVNGENVVSLHEMPRAARNDNQRRCAPSSYTSMASTNNFRLVVVMVRIRRSTVPLCTFS